MKADPQHLTMCDTKVVCVAVMTSDEGHHPLFCQRYPTRTCVAGNGEVVNLFMDYETFGEHQWEETGILAFLRALPAAVLAATTLTSTPTLAPSTASSPATSAARARWAW